MLKHIPSHLLPVQEATGHLLVKGSFTHFLCQKFVPLWEGREKQINKNELTF